MKSQSLKNIVVNLVPKIVNLDKFVLEKIKIQLSKHRFVDLNNKKLGKIGIQYRYDGIQIEPVGVLGFLIKKITINDTKIINSFDNILEQIEQKYISNTEYIIQKIDEIVYDLSFSGVYKPQNSEEKTLYDLAMILLANYYNDDKNVPEWFEHAMQNVQKNEFILRYIDYFVEFISEIIAQVSENIFFDFKILCKSKWLRIFLNKKTNRGQISKLLEFLNINIKKIIYDFAKKYISPSFISGMSEIIVNLITSFLSYNENNNIKSIIPTGFFDITLCFGDENIINTRWFSDEITRNCYIEYSDNRNFESSRKVKSIFKKVYKTYPTLNFGLICGYKSVVLFQHSASIEKIPGDKIYYRICCESSDFKSEIYEINTKKACDEFEFTVFTDTQGMTKQDYDIFKETLEYSLKTKTDFMVHLGDFVDDGSNEEYWNWILESKIWKEMICVPVCGNHDVRVNYLLNKYGFHGNSVLSHFNISEFPNQDFSTGLYYSFEYNNTIFVVLNTNYCEYDTYVDDVQYEWALEVLLKSQHKWKIILTHKSPYSNGPHCDDSDIEVIRKKIIDLAYSAKVDMVLGGHDHVYVRTKELSYGKNVGSESFFCDKKSQSITYVNPFGTIFVVPGTSGVKNYKSSKEISFPVAFNANTTLPVYSTVKITNNSLKFSSFVFDMSKKDSKLLDSFCIEKKDFTQKINSNLLIKMIDSIPDNPCIDKSIDLENILNLYKKLDYCEKLKVINSEKLFNLVNINNNYLEIISKNIKRVRNKSDFLDAIKNPNVGTIILDCDEIDFRKKRKIIINRSISICGNSKISHAKFVVTNNSMFVIGNNLYICDKNNNSIEVQHGSILVTNNDI